MDILEHAYAGRLEGPVSIRRARHRLGRIGVARLKRMPVDVRRVMGAALYWAQTEGVGRDGTRHLGLHPAAARMKGEFSEVVEIRDDDDGRAYRAMYTAKFGRTIYVLHAFQKKSKYGIATPARDLALI